jgi:tRNA-specific adenosine deaminase 3
LHSRFRRCIFSKRMPRTGGMTSDSVDATPLAGGLKHGLFWRPSELNWKFLAWEFKEENKDKQAGTVVCKDMLHV